MDSLAKGTMTLLVSLSLLCCNPHEVKDWQKPPLEPPNDYHHQVVKGKRVVDKWWQEFSDSQLNRWIKIALGENLQVKQAWKRLDQTFALAKIQGAQLLPEVEVESGASLSRRVDRDPESSFSSGFSQGGTGGTTTGGGNQGGTGGAFEFDSTIRETDERYFVSFGLTYELDIWKRIASLTEARALEYEATRKEVEETILLLTGQITEIWFQAIEQKALLQLLRRQVEVSRTLLELTELRLSLGQGSALDILQQRQQLAATKSQIPPVKARLETLLNQLATLLGKKPGFISPERVSSSLVSLPPFPKLSSPMELIYLRPDLNAELLLLQAADYEVAAAVADRLPRFVFSPSYQFSAADFSTFFTQEVGTIAANIVAPLFDAGRRKNEVKRRKAIVKERLFRFGQKFLDVLQEIENALVEEKQQKELLQQIQAQVVLARETLEESKSRYLNGLDNYVSVLLAIQSLQDLQRRAISEKARLLIIRAQLYRALGGKWLTEINYPQDLREPEQEEQEE